MRRLMLASALDRYTARNENFVPVVPPHSGPRRAERAKEILATSQGLCTGYQGQALGWCVYPRSHTHSQR